MALIKFKGKVISAVLNNEFIKMMEVSKSGKQIHVYRAVTIPTPKDSINDGVIENLEEIVKVMGETLDKNGFTASNIIFSISSTKIATKEVIVPNIRPSKLEKLIKSNASEYFPVKVKDYVIEYSVLERAEHEDDKLKIMVAAVNSLTAKCYYELAKALKLNLLYIDYTGNSAYQLVRNQISEGVNLVVEIENDGTVVNIFKDNVLKLQRIVPYGKSLIVDAVMDKYDLSYDAALIKLQNEEILQREFNGDEITESIRYLIGNINRIMDYYSSRNKGEEITKAYVLGNATTIKGFNELLSNEIKKEVTDIIKFNNVVCDKKTGFEKKRLISYLNNIGALIEPVNFIPNEMSKEGENKEEFKVLKNVFICSLVIAGIIIFYPLVDGIILQMHIKNLKQEVSNKSEITEVVNKYYDAKDAYIDAKAFKSLTINNDDALSNLLNGLENNLPIDVIIDNMTVSSGLVTVSGTASSKLSVAKMIQSLSEIEGISNIDVPSIQESEDSIGQTKVTFSMTFNFTDTDSN